MIDWPQIQCISVLAGEKRNSRGTLGEWRGLRVTGGSREREREIDKGREKETKREGERERGSVGQL